jgi:hypothetical protein
VNDRDVYEDANRLREENEEQSEENEKSVDSEDNNKKVLTIKIQTLWKQKKNLTK